MHSFRQAYLAGRYTARDPHTEVMNITAALAAAVRVAALGIRPIVPHASGDHRVTWEKAMTRCDEMLRSLGPARDLVIMLPGWHESRGATIERGWAVSLGLEVVELADLFPAGEVEGVPA